MRHTVNVTSPESIFEPTVKKIRWLRAFALALETAADSINKRTQTATPVAQFISINGFSVGHKERTRPTPLLVSLATMLFIIRKIDKWSLTSNRYH